MAEHYKIAEKEEDKKSKKKWLLLLLLLLLLLIIAICITVWALFFRSAPALSPDYAPRQEEQYAEDIGDSDTSKLSQTEGGGAISITYTTNVEIDLSGKTANLYFVNPSKSNQDIVLQIVVQDVVVARSGTISPGKRVERLDLMEDAASRLSPGGYNGEFKVLYYQPDTHEKTIVNTEIPVNITVK